MKTITTYLILVVLFLGCKKSDSKFDNNISDLEAKKVYLKKYSEFKNNSTYNLVDSLPKEIDWSKSYEMTISGESCLITNLGICQGKRVQIYDHKYPPGIDQHLIFRRDKQGSIYFQLVMTWGNGTPTHGLSLLVFDESGHLNNSYLSDGRNTYFAKVDFFNTMKPTSRNSGTRCTEVDWYTCTQYGGIDLGCTYNYTTVQCLTLPGEEGGSSGNSPGSDPGGSSPFNYGSINKLKYVPFVYAPPTGKIIADVTKYFGCFSVKTTSTYEVTLYVKQPIPDTRILLSDQYGNYIPNSLDLSTRLTVGHTFLGFNQYGGGVNPVSRTIGFYPSTDVTPITPETKGVLVDNSNNEFDVSVTLKVSATEFKTIMDSFISRANSNYNLSWNNCSSIAVDALNAAGKNIPKTIGVWPLGKGADPADLGQDLRLFKSNDIKNKNVSGGMSSLNTAPCK
jgi:hypothetical protein